MIARGEECRPESEDPPTVRVPRDFTLCAAFGVPHGQGYTVKAQAQGIVERLLVAADGQREAVAFRFPDGGGTYRVNAGRALLLVDVAFEAAAEISEATRGRRMPLRVQAERPDEGARAVLQRIRDNLAIRLHKAHGADGHEALNLSINAAAAIVALCDEGLNA